MYNTVCLCIYSVCFYVTVQPIISNKAINHYLCLTAEAHPQHVCEPVFIYLPLLTVAFIQWQTLGRGDGGCPAPWPRPLH